MLSTSGHIAAMVNPPGNEKASYQTATENLKDPEAWLAKASERKGTWWDDWSEWLGERRARRRRPPKLGGKGFKPLQKAPGKYVKG